MSNLYEDERFEHNLRLQKEEEKSWQPKPKKKTKVVRWIEPLGSGECGGIKCEADWRDVADYMLSEYEPRFKEHPNYPLFKTADEAVEDFCITHWATIVDVD